MINLHHGTVQRYSGEQAAAARPCEDLRQQLRIGCRSGFASHRAGGGSRVGAQRELPSQQALDAAAGLEDEYNIGNLQADLPADAAARERDEGRRPPETPLVADHGDAQAVSHADDESAFHQVGNDDNALGVGQQGGRDPAGRDCHDLAEDCPRVVNDDRFAILGPRRCGDQEQQAGDDARARNRAFHRARIVAGGAGQGNGNLTAQNTSFSNSA